MPLFSLESGSTVLLFYAIYYNRYGECSLPVHKYFFIFSFGFPSEIWNILYISAKLVDKYFLITTVNIYMTWFSLTICSSTTSHCLKFANRFSASLKFYHICLFTEFLFHPTLPTNYLDFTQFIQVTRFIHNPVYGVRLSTHSRRDLTSKLFRSPGGGVGWVARVMPSSDVQSF